MDIDLIRQAILANRLRVTDHADEELAADRLTLDDVLNSIVNGEVIEDYPTDRPLPSCLIYGQSGDGTAIHSVLGYNSETGRGVLITVYRPDPERWVDWRLRKPTS